MWCGTVAGPGFASYCSNSSHAAVPMLLRAAETSYGQHRAEHHNAHTILHGLCHQCPFKLCELLDRDGSPDPIAYKEEPHDGIENSIDSDGSHD